MIASTDADGVVKLWDVRMVAEILTIESGKYPANKCAFDSSGMVSGCATDAQPTGCHGQPCSSPVYDNLTYVTHLHYDRSSHAVY